MDSQNIQFESGEDCLSTYLKLKANKQAKLDQYTPIKSGVKTLPGTIFPTRWQETQVWIQIRELELLNIDQLMVQYSVELYTWCAKEIPNLTIREFRRGWFHEPSNFKALIRCLTAELRADVLNPNREYSLSPKDCACLSQPHP